MGVMITTAMPLSAGNAIRLFLDPPAGATTWRVLRKGADDFVDENDDGAIAVYQGDERVVVDASYLQNGVAQFYRPFYWVSGAWQPGATTMATPNATYEDASTDALDILRDRLEAGLFVECERGNFRTKTGTIGVLTAPPTVDTANFPMVTVHLSGENPEVRGVGEDIGGLGFDELEGEWLDTEGWIARVQLAIIVWSLNPDERRDLRKAVRAIIVANLSVFEGLGVSQISLALQDVDAVNGEFNAPIYQSLGTFDCLAPVRVASPAKPIETVEATVQPAQPG